MPKLMVLRGKVLYAHCKYMGVHIRDCLETNIPNVAEAKLLDLKTLVKKGEYNAWKKTFEELADGWIATRDLNKPHHMSQETNVRVHLKPYFGKLKVRDIIKVDEKTGKSMVNDFLAEIDHRPKESVMKIRYCLQSILKRGQPRLQITSVRIFQSGLLPRSIFGSRGVT